MEPSPSYAIAHYRPCMIIINLHAVSVAGLDTTPGAGDAAFVTITEYLPSSPSTAFNTISVDVVTPINFNGVSVIGFLLNIH